MKKQLILAVVALAALATPARAAVSIHISFGRPVTFHPPVVVCHPPVPVYVPLPPACAPRPVFVVRPVPPPHRPVVVLSPGHHGSRWVAHRQGWGRDEHRGRGRR